VLRVARTLADLEGIDAADGITEGHLHEAINYRMLDRQMWT
jgi:magnesium chelatase family protein